MTAMADPFSIAGSAVGVVSLGLLACQELHSLIDDVRTAKDKAEAISASLDRLENHLEQLETELGKHASTSSVAASRADLMVCREAFTKIRQRLPAAGVNSSNIRQQIQTLRFRFSYPFKKGDLQYLKSLAKDIQGDLQMALQIVAL